MPRYIDVDKAITAINDEMFMNESTKSLFRMILRAIPTADVVPRAEVFEEVDKFRTNIMNKFIYLCRGNDYNRLTLLKIGDVVNEMYDVQIAELKKKYTEGNNDR